MQKKFTICKQEQCQQIIEKKTLNKIRVRTQKNLLILLNWKKINKESFINETLKETHWAFIKRCLSKNIKNSDKH